MNDPNGLIYHDGVYHLFYQHNPHGLDWGEIHWGHATSADLVHWTHQPLALAPDPAGLGLVASGCVVLDERNTSGFRGGANPVMVAVFSHFTPDHRQIQSLAYSNDLGASWTMFSGNPVLEEPLQDFRDPKVFWYARSEHWVMTIAARDHIRIYTSPDLRGWTLTQTFGAEDGAHGDVWECPDLFELPVDGDALDTRWVMLVSVQGGAPNGGSGTQYFLGQFDGSTFHLDDGRYPQWFDWGPDNYASVSWSGMPDDQRVVIGWMSNWKYARDVPATAWRGSMTLPRRIALARVAGEVRLTNRPLPRVTDLRQPPVPVASEGETRLLDPAAQVSVTLDGEDAPGCGGELVLRSDAGDELRIVWEPADDRVVIDRRAAVGGSGFLAQLVELPLPRPSGSLALEVFLDVGSVEVFVDGGVATATALIFPRAPLQRLSLRAQSTVRAAATVHPLRSIWF